MRRSQAAGLLGSIGYARWLTDFAEPIPGETNHSGPAPAEDQPAPRTGPDPVAKELQQGHAGVRISGSGPPRPGS